MTSSSRHRQIVRYLRGIGWTGLAIWSASVAAHRFLPFWIGAGLLYTGKFLVLAAVTASACLLPWRWAGLRCSVLGISLEGALLAGSLVGAVIELNHPRGWIGLSSAHVYGAHGRSGSCAYQWHHTAFAVRYHFDSHGWRITPDAPAQFGDVLCLGCSFTFGAGVRDEEAFPAVLGAQYWNDRKVRNCGLSGRGVGDGLLVLQEWLQNQAPPSLVIYGWITGQLPRNSPRRSWHQRGFNGSFQLFEIEHGRAVFRGTQEATLATWPDNSVTDEYENRLCRAIFHELARLCQENRISLLVVDLSEPFEPRDADPVMIQLKRDGIRLLDLRQLRGPFFPQDGHPTARWHAEVAAAIAAEMRPFQNSLRPRVQRLLSGATVRRTAKGPATVN